MGLADRFHVFWANMQAQNGAKMFSRYRAITKRRNIDFWETASDKSHSLYVGSQGRDTATHSTSDVDRISQLPCSV